MNCFLKYLLNLTFILLFSNNIFSQFSFKKTDSLKVFDNTKLMKMPFAGGFNYMQFSELDLDYDGVNDLFSFDRSSNKPNTFLNAGITDSIDYTYAPQFLGNIPKGLKDWVLLADYNCDGKQDIFTQNGGAIKIYKNDGNANIGLHFTLVTQKLYSIYFSDSIPLYVSSVDIPAISDIDSDGDLDIVTFSSNGVYVEYHQNLSKELYGNCDSLKFSLATSCWGDFKEDQSSCQLTFNLPCGNLVHQNTLEEERDILHSGSALLALDLDGDNDKDLLLADIGCSTITAVTNGGTITDALATAEDITFPSYNVPINLTIFPTPFLCDVNNDGKKDLLVSPNTTTGSENKFSSLLYKNIGSNSIPNFKYQNNEFLVKDMIDNGAGAYPTFFDFNNDGLLDILIGNIGRFENSLNKARLMLYKNIGTTNYPIYKLEDDDYLNLSTASNLNYLKTTFGDLDNDTDLDMLIGNGDGKLFYYQNVALLGAIANFQFVSSYYGSIDIGNCAAPQLIDIDVDGKIDLLIGTQKGYIKYYRNTGTSQNPTFTLISNTFGNVYTGYDNGVLINDGFCTPQLFNVNGSNHLLCGSKSGSIYRYTNIDNNLGGTFTKIDSSYLNIWEGNNSSLSIADINNDGQLDMLVGNICGGLNYFSGDITASIYKTNIIEDLVNIYPNPASDFITLISKNTIKNLFISDCQGRIIRNLDCNSNSFEINTSQLNNGIYFIKIQVKNSIISKKLIVKH